MAECTSTPDDPSKRLAYQIGGDFPPPRSGRWVIIQPCPEVCPALFWSGQANDLATALPKQVRQLMTVQRTFYAIQRGHRISLKYEPKRVCLKGRVMYWLCNLADYGNYILNEDGGFSWIELPIQPRVEAELSKRLLTTTRRR